MPKKIPEGTCPKAYLGQDLDLDPEPDPQHCFRPLVFFIKKPHVGP
jgi:hypothetical protein